MEELKLDSSINSNPSNAFNHAEYLYKENLINQNDFSDVIQKIKDEDNQKDWCDDYVTILSSICEKSQCYRYMHESANTYYRKLSYRITYSSMIFSGAMSGFSIVATKLENTIRPDLATLISGMGHLIIAGIIGFQKKMNLPESAEMHEKASQDFDIFCRKIEFQLRLPITDRSAVPKMVFDSIDRYENLVISNPQIPINILNYFRHTTTALNIDKPSIVKSFTIMPKLLKDDISKINENFSINVNCKKTTDEIKKLRKECKKYMPELSPTIKNINMNKIDNDSMNKIDNDSMNKINDNYYIDDIDVENPTKP